jgi:hypothetical protein
LGFHRSAERQPQRFIVRPNLSRPFRLLTRARCLAELAEALIGHGRSASISRRNPFRDAKAQSLPEALKLYTEFFQKLATQTTEQTKEFFDLSTRATQHVLEQVQAASTKAIKPAA